MDRHESLHVIGIGKWLILFVAVALLFGFLLWGLMGRTVITLTYPGVVSDDLPVKYVYSHMSGNVEQVSVKRGEDVSFGETMMLIASQDEYGLYNDEALESVKSTLPTRQVYAPIDGEVLAVYVNNTEYVEKMTPLMTIARDRDHETAYYFYSLVPRSRIGDIRPGMVAYVSGISGSQAGKQAVGVVERVMTDTKTEQLIKDFVPWTDVQAYLLQDTDALMTVPVRILLYQADDNVYWMRDGTKGPVDFEYGDVVNVEFEISNYRPIDLILPSGAGTETETELEPGLQKWMVAPGPKNQILPSGAMK